MERCVPIPLRCVQASIDDLSELHGEAFDVVIQPVSSCYVADPLAVYEQVALVTQRGALYLSQHKLAASMLVAARSVNRFRMHLRLKAKDHLNRCRKTSRILTANLR